MLPKKFQNKYRIPSARAVWHNYNSGDYFITICTADRLHYFGEIRNGEMHKNRLGQKLDELLLDIKTHNPYTEIPVYQIMPNHVHLIVCISDSGSGSGSDCRDAACHVSTVGKTAGTGKPDEPVVVGKNEKMRNIAVQCGLLSTAVGGLKSALTNYARLNKIQFGWQTRFHDHIIRDQAEMERIATYIENNVANWENDTFYTRHTPNNRI
jgi:REP element-mobilizing transposase RayT